MICITYRMFLITLTTFFLNVSVSNSATLTVNNTNDAGAGSLRDAMTLANSSAGNDYINFNLGAGGPFTITLLSALPTLTDNAGLTIDGWNNSGNNGTPNTIAVFSTSIGSPLNPVYKIILANGNNIPVGITISSTFNMIRGLVLQDFGDGTPSNNDMCIRITAGSNTVVGCYLGMAQDGATMGTRPFYGVYIAGPNNRIGDGTNAGVNLISGMGGNGGTKIYITGATATANIVRGNIIGLQSNGTSALTASATGISLITSAHSNTIGGTGTFDGNLISGNRGTGISISTNSNVIQGNYIGPLSDGVTGLTGSMQSNGMSNGGSFNLIGGSVPGARNLISGNTNLGMDMSGSNNIIRGNYWGTNKFGTARISVGNNGGFTINTGTGNIVGGTGAGEGNVISGFPSMGFWLLNQPAGAGQNTIQQNTVGLAANGTSSLTGGGNANGFNMMLGARNFLIGGNTSAARNIISGNSTGITMNNNVTTNTVQGNYIGLAGDGMSRVTGANQTNGISITAGTLNLIGGTGAGQGNVISGNTTYGIYLSTASTSLNTVLQNTIGLQANASSTLTGGNTQSGIYIDNSNSNVIGGSTGSTSRNIISGNSAFGIGISGASASLNLVSGNYIGVSGTSGSVTGANQVNGVRIITGANTNTIGGYSGAFGTNPQGNLISRNTGDGIYVFSLGAVSNLISRNLIYSNGAASLPINLNYGANQGNAGKAVPVIMTVTTTIVTGSNAATAGVGDTVEVFTNNTGNCRDLMSYKGSTLATAAGNWTLTGITINQGESAIATARTVANNNTSQVSICTVPLPVELSLFNVECINNEIVIKWVTESELDTRDFIIERSEDGEHYRFVGKVKARGRSVIRNEYILTDPFPQNNERLYRLRQNDENGNVEYYYAHLLASCEEVRPVISVFPSPVTEKLKVACYYPHDLLVNVYLTDMNGSKLFSKTNWSGKDLLEINVSELPGGTYVLTVSSPIEEFNTKVIKE